MKGFTARHPDVPPGCGAPTPAGPRGRDRYLVRPRGHGGRAAAGPPVVSEGFLSDRGPDQLLGLQLDRLLRTARGLLGRRPPAPEGLVDEFKDMVKRLHRAGIEVILDVVYNHTAEGGEHGPTLCFRGLTTRPTTGSSPATPAGTIGEPRVRGV